MDLAESGLLISMLLISMFILEGGKLIILIDCMIFLSTFLDAIRISMSIVSSLVQLGSGFL